MIKSTGSRFSGASGETTRRRETELRDYLERKTWPGELAPVYDSIEAIDVKDGVITISTKPRPTTRAVRAPRSCCRRSRELDVADFTAGHTVLSETVRSFRHLRGATRP